MLSLLTSTSRERSASFEREAGEKRSVWMIMSLHRETFTFLTQWDRQLFQCQFTTTISYDRNYRSIKGRLYPSGLGIKGFLFWASLLLQNTVLTGGRHMLQRADLMGWSINSVPWASFQFLHIWKKSVAVLSCRLVPFLLCPLHHYDSHSLPLSSSTQGSHLWF